MSDVQINMICCTESILDTIKVKGCTRKMIAMLYALARRSEERGVESVDWARINKAIIENWSVSGLLWIKTQAWNGKCFEEK